MNTNDMSFDELAALQEKAKSELEALPVEQQARFYQAAKRRYALTWSKFSSEAQDTCALLEYIASLPEPRTRH
jgi:hypothetical protein